MDTRPDGQFASSSCRLVGHPSPWSNSTGPGACWIPQQGYIRILKPCLQQHCCCSSARRSTERQLQGGKIAAVAPTQTMLMPDAKAIAYLR
jgi:hypothetical protein